MVSSVLRRFNLRYDSLRVAAILLILVVMLRLMTMLNRRMGFIIILTVKNTAILILTCFFSAQA